MGVFHKPSSDSSQTKVKNDLYICERCEKTYEGLQELNNHFCEPRPPQSIHCEQCPYMSLVAATREAIVDHRIEKHEDLGVLNQI